MVDTIYYSIIVILFLSISFSVFLELLNIKSRSNSLTGLLSDVYDSENYSKQQHYEKEKLKISLIESLLSAAIIILFFSMQGFGLLQMVVAGVTSSVIAQTLLFFGILGFATLILSIPFDYYDKFVIEEKFGFNKSTKRLFWVDLLKSVLLSAILGGAILAIITWLYVINPNLFWISALGVILTFSLIMNALYSTIILPLFNKKTPLQEGELKQKVLAFAGAHGFSINHIYLIDGSKRSTKANAFFTGFGSKKRVFLYDTLVEKLSNDEVVAVLAHELGHYKKHHIWINLSIGVVQSAILLFVFNLISQNLEFTQAMGSTSSTAVFYLNALCFVLLISPIQTILSILLNWMSRKMEYQADYFAKVNGFGNELVSALKKIASLNYSNLTPHPFYVVVNYSHPSLYNRIKTLVKTH